MTRPTSSDPGLILQLNAITQGATCAKRDAVLVSDTSPVISAAPWRTSPNLDYHADLKVDAQIATDELLTFAAKSGNSAAFDELSRRHSKRIKRHIYRIVRNWEDTEDVLQDSLLKAFMNIAELRADCAFSTWLTRIAINSALMVLRKRRTHTQDFEGKPSTSTNSLVLQELPDLSPTPESICAERQVQESLRGAILHLPWSFRSVTELYLARDCSTREVAETLGITVGAVKSRLMRARKALRASAPELHSRMGAGRL
jgi:RNA polymerase sigma-70 factor (ECF subfamily)